MTRDERLVEILGEWLEARESGSRLGVDALTAAHPDLASELRRHVRLMEVVTDGAGSLDVEDEDEDADAVGDAVDDRPTLGRYVLERELGKGGMGTVYLARQSDGTAVALKVVHAHLLQTEGFFKRFIREAEVGRRIRHENVVRTLDYDAIVDNGQSHHFLVMEYVEGQTLRELADELDRVPEELCRHVAREICKGLGAIHAAGAVHRDLKPENVLITEDHVVKVMDLGVARLIDESVRLSQTGAFVGSVHYAAPEQFRGGAAEVDARADLYALGLLLYEISGGEHPFVGDDVAQVLKKILHDEPRRLGDVNPQLSPFFEELVHALLAKDREHRFSSADDLLTVLVEGEDSTWWRERARAVRAVTNRPLRRIRIPRETAVYGRETEIERLRGLFEQAKSGDGRAVLIEGEAGIGKSRLVDELIGRLRADGEDVHFLFGSYPPGGAAAAAGGLSTAFREQFGDAGSAAYLPHTPLLVPAFDAVLRGEPAPADALQLTPGSLGTCFVHVTRNLAAEQTTIVLIDDLHFAPEDARDLFTTLALAVPDHRILLVGTTRPGLPEEWVANLMRLDQSSQLPLERLGPKDLALLLNDSFRSDQLAHQLGHQVALKSDGNPFFVFEIIRGLREGQFITQSDDGTWVSTRVVEDIQIPSSVLDLVNARVADLTEQERDLLDVASCCGFEFDPAIVAAAVGESLLPTLKRFAAIEKRHRLVRAAGRRLVFDHHQVQEALYGALYEQMREAYHAAIADALATRANAADKEPEALDGALCVELCEHYLKGARGEDALRYLKAAQTHLSEHYLHAQVVSLTERALAVPDLLTGTERAHTLLRLCVALDMIGRRTLQEESAREVERLAEEAGDDELLGNAANAIGGVFWRTSRHTDAEAAFRRALELAVARGDQKAEAAATGNLGNVFFSEGRLPEAREHYERSLVLSREIGNRSGEANAICWLGRVFWSEGRLREAREHQERSLALSREIGNRQFEAAAAGNLGIVSRSEGRLREAREHQERYLALSREIGDRAGEALAQHNLGGALREEGESAPAEERLFLSLSLSEEIGHRRLTAGTHLALGSLRAAASGGVGGLESLAAARDLAAEMGFPVQETLARCELACLPGGDADDALAAFTANDEHLDAEQRREARWLLFRATGDRAHLEEAKRLLDESVAHVDDETRTSMLTNLRIPREIMAAWNGESDAPDDPDDEEPRGTESVTRVES